MARTRTEPASIPSPPEPRPEVRAQAKWVRLSPRKARLVAAHIRGRTVPEARTMLAFTERAAARELEKVLQSAVANAEANHDLIGDDLLVSAAYVDEGPTIRRWRARARGRVARIRKPTCHITVKLAPVPEPPAVRRVPEAPSEEAPKRAPRPRAPMGAAAPTAEEKPKRQSRPRKKKEEAK
jgi:large subunit ribosomal protein L22